MYTFLLQLRGLLESGTVQFYGVFFIVGMLLWITRVVASLAHRDKRQPFRGTFSVLVPTYEEDPALFERSLKSIRTTGPQELIVTLDGPSPKNLVLAVIAKRYADTVHIMEDRCGKRRQFAAAVGLMRHEVDVIITVDSDSIWTDTTLRMLRPFADPRVGGVTGRQAIYDRSRTIVRRFADWLEDIRYRMVIPFQSRYGQVLVMPGRTLAVRAELYKELIADVSNEAIFGRTMFSGDDGAVTMEILRRGYKTAYQSDSLTYTNAPDTLRGVWRQYTRWYRNGYRRFFSRLPQYRRINPIVTLMFLSHLFGGVLFTGLMSGLGAKLHFGLLDSVTQQQVEQFQRDPLLAVGLIIGGYYLSAVVRQVLHLIHHPVDILFLPLFSLFTFFVLAPARFYALFSYLESGWRTRGSDSNIAKNGSFFKTRSVAATSGVAVGLVLIPTPFFVDVAALNVPQQVLWSEQASEYIEARAAVADYQREMARARGNTKISYAKQKQKLLKLTKRIAAKKKLTVSEQNLLASSGCAAEQIANARTASRDPLAIFDSCASRDFSAAIAAQLAVPTTAPKTKANKTPVPTINLTVSSGDSQTSLVRAHMSRDLPARGISLTPGQRIYVETAMIKVMSHKNALTIGEVIHFTEAKYLAAISEARALGPSVLVGWESRAKTVVF